MIAVSRDAGATLAHAEFDDWPDTPWAGARRARPFDLSPGPGSSKSFGGILQSVREQYIQAVATTSLDRIARSVTDLLVFSNVLQDQDNDVNLIIARGEVDTSAPKGKRNFRLLLAVSGFGTEF